MRVLLILLICLATLAVLDAARISFSEREERLIKTIKPNGLLYKHFPVIRHIYESIHRFAVAMYDIFWLRAPSWLKVFTSIPIYFLVKMFSL